MTTSSRNAYSGLLDQVSGSWGGFCTKSFQTMETSSLASGSSVKSDMLDSKPEYTGPSSRWVLRHANKIIRIVLHIVGQFINVQELCVCRLFHTGSPNVADRLLANPGNSKGQPVIKRSLQQFRNRFTNYETKFYCIAEVHVEFDIQIYQGKELLWSICITRCGDHQHHHEHRHHHHHHHQHHHHHHHHQVHGSTIFTFIFTIITIISIIIIIIIIIVIIIIIINIRMFIY